MLGPQISGVGVFALMIFGRILLNWVIMVTMSEMTDPDVLRTAVGVDGRAVIDQYMIDRCGAVGVERASESVRILSGEPLTRPAAARVSRRTAPR